MLYKPVNLLNGSCAVYLDKYVFHPKEIIEEEARLLVFTRNQGAYCMFVLKHIYSISIHFIETFKFL